MFVMPKLLRNALHRKNYGGGGIRSLTEDFASQQTQ